MDTKVANKLSIMKVLETAAPAQIPALPEIGERFKELYSIIHPGAKADLFYEAEKFHFAKLVKDNTNLQACTKLSLYGCFMDVAVNGLSFDPSFKHLYIVPYNINVGTRDNPKWEKRASLQISGYGELLLRQLQGQIKYADTPVLVYEGDDFAFGTRDEKFFLSHVVNLSRRTEKIVACYVKIVRFDNSIDYKVITQDDMNRFRKFSRDKDSKAWTDGEAGMWVAKCIKHAFKSYPKVRTGKFSELASSTVDEEAEVVPGSAEQHMRIPETIDYGLNGSTPRDAPAARKQDEDEFMNDAPPATGGTIQIEEDGDDF